jgi:hypothetical protein
LVGRYGRHSAPSAITWLGWHHCPGWHSKGAAAVPQLHFHAVGWPTAQAGITCISLCPRTCLAWATPMDMAIASSATEQVFSMSRPPAAKNLLYRAAKFLGNRSRAPQPCSSQASAVLKQLPIVAPGPGRHPNARGFSFALAGSGCSSTNFASRLA